VRRCIALTFVVVLAGCRGEDPIPIKPTWNDVQPILRGNCFSCHGSQPHPGDPRVNPVALRWDVFDPSEAMTALGLTNLGDNIAGASIGVAMYLPDPKPPAGPNQFGRAFMPPPPADTLSDRDIAVLQRWSDAKFPKGSRPENQKPTVTWLTRPTVFEVQDADLDQVLGKLTCGTTVTPLTRSGGWTLPAGSAPPCQVVLYDGWDTVTTTLQ
jgi:hypothetical protein